MQRVELDETATEPTVVAHVRPVAAQRSRCGMCRRRRPGYYPGTGPRAPGGAGGGGWGDFRLL
ncbi:MAG: hypothetical protein ACXVHC_06070 [Frankiaceae bacterium]